MCIVLDNSGEPWVLIVRMLLLFEDQDDKSINDPMVGGGIEMFCRSIYENFDDVEVLQMPFERTGKKGATKEKARIKQSIINKAEDINADVILSNYTRAIFYPIESPIPIMFVQHSFWPFPVIDLWTRVLEKGHSLFLVSELQDKYYRKQARRFNFKYPSLTGFITPGYCKLKQDILTTEYDCGTIGRCQSDKDPFKLKHMTKDTDLKTLVITQTPTYNKVYYERNKHWDNVVWDKPYVEVMRNVAKCGTYFSTWNKETWGITSMEALSCGVPVILNSNNDGDHASEVIPASPSHFKKIINNDKELLTNAIKSLSKIDKKEVQEMTWEKHSLENWKLQLFDAVSKTISNHKRPVMSQFFN